MGFALVLGVGSADCIRDGDERRTALPYNCCRAWDVALVGDDLKPLGSRMKAWWETPSLWEGESGNV
jgi:hypothetical protein